MTDSFVGLPRGHFKAILADPPWLFETYSLRGRRRSPKYKLMAERQIIHLPVKELAADDSALFLWITWPTLLKAIRVMQSWGFEYKTCAFCWIKANGTQIQLFNDDIPVHMKLGYWTRSNSEVCLFGTRGRPERLSSSVRQAIIEPAREHSRKPDCIHERIEQLVGGPYLELFARQKRENWTVWGDEIHKFPPAKLVA